MNHEIEEPQSELSAQKAEDSLHSHQAEIEPNSDSRPPAEHVEQDSGKAGPQSSQLPDPRGKQSRLLASVATLKSKITDAESQLSVKTQEIRQLQSFQQQHELKDDLDKAALEHAQVIANRNISLLKRYNEIKDIAMGMLSLIAEKEGKRLAEVMEERGVGEKD